jgi:hypothetical protein
VPVVLDGRADMLSGLLSIVAKTIGADGQAALRKRDAKSNALKPSVTSTVMCLLRYFDLIYARNAESCAKISN